MIRRATLVDDFMQVLGMALDFIKVSPYKDHYSFQKISAVVIECLNTPDKAVFLSEHGMLIGIIVPFIYGDGINACELAWWVDPAHRKSSEGKELLDAFELWARDQGCQLITMISLDNDLGRYYEKKGYRLFERAYMKEL